MGSFSAEHWIIGKQFRRRPIYHREVLNQSELGDQLCDSVSIAERGNREEEISVLVKPSSVKSVSVSGGTGAVNRRAGFRPVAVSPGFGKFITPLLAFERSAFPNHLKCHFQHSPEWVFRPGHTSLPDGAHL